MTALPRLTGREHDVLVGFAKGLTDHAIARGWSVSPATVRSAASSLYRKLDVRSQSHAVAVGYELELLRPGTVDVDHLVDGGSNPAHRKLSSIGVKPRELRD